MHDFPSLPLLTFLHTGKGRGGCPFHITQSFMTWCYQKSFSVLVPRKCCRTGRERWPFLPPGRETVYHGQKQSPKEATHCLEQDRFCCVLFCLFCPRGRKKPRPVTGMLCGEEQWSQGTLWQWGQTSCYVIMFSCNNDRYAYRSNNDDCCRQSSNAVEIFALWGYPDFVHTNIPPQSPDEPIWPIGTVCLGRPSSAARDTKRADCT